MAVATSVQPQWDIGNSAFSVSGKIWGLMKAATVDDVQPAAVYAAEAIGSQMIVDPHLIGKAVDALGGDQSYRLDNIKLHIGLCSGGVAGQVRLSPAATKAFLLITVLRLHMQADEIGDLLFEFIVESNLIEKAPVSSKQLRDFVRSVESHSLKLRESETLPIKIIHPLLTILAEEGRDFQQMFFEPLSPIDASKLLVPLFEAMRDAETQHINVTGEHSAIWLASLLCWLCPDEVEVLDSGKNVIVACSSTPARVSMTLGPSMTQETPHRKWSMERWYSLDKPSSLFDIARDDTYPPMRHPKVVPNELTLLYLHVFQSDISREELDTITVLAHGFMLAALDHGMLARDNSFDAHPQSIRFQNICNQQAEMKIRNGSTEWGLSLSSEGLEDGRKIARFFGQESPDLSPQNRERLFQRLNEEVLSGKLMKNSKRTLLQMNLAMWIAETVLVRATQTGFPEISFRAVFDDVDECFSILCPLLDGSYLSASKYFYWSLASLIMRPRWFSDGEGPISIIAASGNGLVAYCRGFQCLPRIPAEAFAIVVQPGQLKWRNVRHTLLYEYPERPSISIAPRCSNFNLANVDQSRVKLAPLIRLDTPRPEFSIKLSSRGIHLRCKNPSTGDESTELGAALINWALANRPQPSSQRIEEQCVECVSLGIESLELKCPGFDGVYYGDKWAAGTVAVATCSGDALADLLRFGTYEAKILHCIEQGSANIFDCVLQAQKQFGGGYIIMAST